MGYGAYLSIRNDSSETVQCRILSQQCMYDHGVEGSNLSLFDDAFIAANTALPITGGHYIESKSSGDCASMLSSFELQLYKPTKGNITLHFIAEDERYRLIKQQPNVNVSIEYTSNQSTIIVNIKELNP